MPVFQKSTKWPGSIPYVWDGTPLPPTSEPQRRGVAEAGIKAGNDAIAALNEAVGWELLYPLGSGTRPSNYLTLSVKNSQGISAIGMQTGPQVVELIAPVSICLHELMHALGFHHEDKHAAFPWWRSGVDNQGNLDGNATEWERLLYKKLVEAYNGPSPSAGAVQSLSMKAQELSGPKRQTSRRGSLERQPSMLSLQRKGSLSRSDGPTEPQSPTQPRNLLAVVQKVGDLGKANRLNGELTSWDLCDMGSIMMYREVRQAFNNAKMEDTAEAPGHVAGGKSNDELSRLDIRALRHVYPEPRK